MFLHEAKQILRKPLLLRPRSLDNSKEGLHLLILATAPCMRRARCIPTCSCGICYCSLPSLSASPSSFLKVTIKLQQQRYTIKLQYYGECQNYLSCIPTQTASLLPKETYFVQKYNVKNIDFHIKHSHQKTGLCVKVANILN